LEKEEIKQKYYAIYKDIDTSNKLNLLYYPIFMIRRLFLTIIVLYYSEDLEYIFI
jgi:hypothetical protein